MLPNDPRAKLFELFDALVDFLLEALKGKDTEVKASLLAVARALLLDNEINARSRADLGSGLRALVDARALPFAPKLQA